MLLRGQDTPGGIFMRIFIYFKEIGLDKYIRDTKLSLAAEVLIETNID
jgi:hypothetical protein